jgi:hypothetical protein
MFLSYVLRFFEEHKTYISRGTLRNIRDLCSSGFPEKRNLDYVPRCHVVEEHTLYSSVLTFQQAYVPRDTFLDYVPRFSEEHNLFFSTINICFLIFG